MCAFNIMDMYIYVTLIGVHKLHVSVVTTATTAVTSSTVLADRVHLMTAIPVDVRFVII